MTDIERLILANQVLIMQALYDNNTPTAYKNIDNPLHIGIKQTKEELAK